MLLFLQFLIDWDSTFRWLNETLLTTPKAETTTIRPRNTPFTTRCLLYKMFTPHFLHGSWWHLVLSQPRPQFQTLCYLGGDTFKCLKVELLTSKSNKVGSDWKVCTHLPSSGGLKQRWHQCCSSEAIKVTNPVNLDWDTYLQKTTHLFRVFPLKTP